ncbi:MAG: hypothetical protein HYR91_11345 [Flavobacteriia bacterium]|nr:hypothetical protein [Flavobacteriia bacterium]
MEYFVVSSRTAANGEKYRTEAHGTLDGNGEAVVELRQKNRTYSVRVVEPANTCYNKQITQYFDSKYDVNGTFTFEFAECGNFKLNIHNLNCEGSTDIMKFRNRYSYTEWQSWSTNRIGCYDLNSVDFVTIQSGWRIYEYTVTRSSGTTSFIDSVYIPENGNVIYNLNY